MGTLFYIDDKNKILLHEECYKVCPELQKLSQEELLFVICYVDYKGPFHQWPDEEKLRKSKRYIWGTKDIYPEKREKMARAIKFYKSLQYDPKRATIENYQNKIDLLNSTIISETNPTKLKQYLDAVRMLNSEIQELQEEVDKNELYEAQLKGGGKKSLLERLQANNDLYILKNRGEDKVGIEVDFPDGYEDGV